MNLRSLLIVGLGAAALTISASAVPDLVINSFDAAAEVPNWPTDDFPANPGGVWQRWWGDAITDGISCTFDAAYDAAASATSGGMKVTANFTDAGNQWSMVKYSPDVFDASKYVTLEMDIRFLPGSATRPNGSFGYLEFGFADVDYGQLYAFQADIPESAATSWFHISAPIPLTALKIDRVRGIHMKIWGGDAANQDKIRGASTFWVDNIKLIGKPDNVPDVIPSLEVTKAGPGGLQMIAADPGIYARQNIRTATRGYSWLERAQPVTYSLTISDYPATPDFQVHMYLVPGPDSTVGMNYPDYGVPDCTWIQIGGNAAGGGYMNLRYKVNAPDSNGVGGHEYWAADDGINGGNLASVGGATIRGTWSVTFTSATDFTLTAPDGTTATGAFSAATAAEFAGPMYVYFGIVPGGEDRKGKSATLSRVTLAGFPASIDEQFVTPQLDLGIWEVSATVPAAIVTVVPSEKPVWVSWSLPAVGYVLQFSPGMTDASWVEFPSATAFNTGSGRNLFINRSSLTDPDAAGGFFRLYKP